MEVQSLITKCCQILTAATCGKRPAAVSVGTITRNRTPRTQELLLAAELWRVAGACRRLPPFSLCCHNRSIFLMAQIWRCCGSACTNCARGILLFFSSPCVNLVHYAVYTVQLAAICSIAPMCVLQSVNCTTSSSGTRGSGCSNQPLTYMDDFSTLGSPFAPRVAICYMNLLCISEMRRNLTVLF